MLVFYTYGNIHKLAKNRPCIKDVVRSDQFRLSGEKIMSQLSLELPFITSTDLYSYLIDFYLSISLNVLSLVLDCK